MRLEPGASNRLMVRRTVSAPLCDMAKIDFQKMGFWVTDCKLNNRVMDGKTRVK